MRPVMAKALIINAFAITGRIMICDTFTQGVLALASGRAERPWAMRFCPFGAYCCDF